MWQNTSLSVTHRRPLPGTIRIPDPGSPSEPTWPGRSAGRRSQAHNTEEGRRCPAIPPSPTLSSPGSRPGIHTRKTLTNGANGWSACGSTTPWYDVHSVTIPAAKRWRWRKNRRIRVELDDGTVAVLRIPNAAERQKLVGVMRQLILCHRKVAYWPQSGAATSVNSASDD